MKPPKEKQKEKKVFVLDTNVIVHDYDSIFKFQEHDVCIPSVVMQELDSFKKGNETINVNVREFHRKLKKLRETLVKKTFTYGKVSVEKMVPALSHGGVCLGDGMGKIEVIRVPKALHPLVKENFFDEKPDNRILSAARFLEEKELRNGKRKVILVTKDYNLQNKADILGITVEDYENDKVPNIDLLYTGRAEIIDDRLVPLINLLYNDNQAPIFGQEYSVCFDEKTMKANMFFTLKTSTVHCLACVDTEMENLIRVEKRPVAGISPRNAEQVFAVHACLNPNIQLVTLQGPAGTGKTLLAMAAAIELSNAAKYKKILLSAAMVPLSNREIGFLPGDEDNKVSPLMQGLFDNLDLIKTNINGSKDQTKEKNSVKKNKNGKHPKKGKSGVEIDSPVVETQKDYITLMQENGRIKIQALAHIRGRSLNNTLFIIDEAQNLTKHEVKTIITRAGFNTKIIFLGDIKQIDTPYLDDSSNGLSITVDKLAGKRIIAHVTLKKGERSELATLAADLL